jgi:predicted pyridoxine 5'-phosphate oxidase superfamily flavin-nucleotide-binding protein
VGLIFLVPGFEEVVRVNGTARLSVEPDLIARFPVEGKLPRSVLLIDVQEALLHCAKAVHRAGLWDPASHVERSAFPSAGQILRDQLSLDTKVSAVDDYLAKDLRDNLY